MTLAPVVPAAVLEGVQPWHPGLNTTPRIPTSPSSRGPGHRPFTAVTRVRISVGTPPNLPDDSELAAPEVGIGQIECDDLVSPKPRLASEQHEREHGGNRF